ncbi:MAG: prepilin-type N-terminal cleavage/methylation domain-containing protein [Sulfuriferula multivorans]|uniref:Type II secretion system protein H n=1 Tax=Sulfuriferula multivorans TaxID=1559896 RepID=A0A7C9KBV2_9PROT|nr:prepilin-type N-terminal cleavage/methylation domain-containing protein [Sulfuriferula multivorans]
MEERGFTLVELLVVLTIGSILLSIAIPGYAFLLSGSRLTTVTNDLVSALHLARSEAIKRGTRVTICKTGSPMAVPPSCDGAANWQDGWLVFVDGGVRGVIDSGDTVLWSKDRASEATTITASNFTLFVSYLPSGVSQGPNGLANGFLRVCVEHKRRDIIINSTGRLRLSPNIC